MLRASRRGTLVTGLTLALALLIARAPVPSEAHKIATDPIVVASIFPLAAVSREIAGPRAKVVTVLTPGANPHAFEPTPSQVWAAAGAHIVVRVGLGFDDWVLPVVEGSGTQPEVVLASEGLKLIPLAEDEHGHQHDSTWDPHLWLDPENAMQLAGRLADALSRIDPAARKTYEARRDHFVELLRRVDAEIESLLQPHAGAGFVGTHAAWAYFARRYGLRQVAVVERSPGRMAGPRYLLRVAETARRERVRAVFAEVQLATGEAQIIAEETGLPIVMLDPIGGEDVENRSTYVDLLRWNARRMALAFAGRSVQ